MRAIDVAAEAPGPAVAVDSDNRILAMNRPAREMLGISGRASLAGEPLFALLEARDVFGNRLADSSMAFREMIDRREEVHSFEISLRKRSGDRMRAVLHVVVVLGPGDNEFNLIYLLSPVLRRRKADEAIERLLRGGGVADASTDGAGPDPPEPPNLTPRQIEVLRLLARGANVDEIAGTLGISVHTARTHLQDIYGRMGVHSQVEAVARAYRERLI